MKTIFLVLAVCLATVASLPRQQERIVGGTVTNINSYPFAASLQVTRNNVNFGHTCGGTIINNRSILSAVHCWVNNNVANRYRIRVGSTNASSGGRVHNVAQLFGHPHYSNRNHDNDIGVVRVSTAIPLGSATIRAGSLAGANINIPDNSNVIAIGWGLTSYNNRNHDNDICVVRISTSIPLGSATIRAGSLAGANINIPDNSNVIAIGWGLTSHHGRPSEQLRHVSLRTVNQARCNTDFRGIITANMLCAGASVGRGTCFGDSGTGLVFNNVVVGVCSFIHWDGCASGWPNVFARVSRYVAWIRNHS